MSDRCELRKANDIHGADCDGEACVFWRAVGHLGEPEGSGCALKHYEMLGDSQMAAWLLSVKERVEKAATGG